MYKKAEVIRVVLSGGQCVCCKGFSGEIELK